MKYQCTECQGFEIQQEFITMVNINANDPWHGMDFQDAEANDYFYCMECGEPCDVKEIE